MLYIITAVYNRRDTTERFIMSLLTQTKKDIRLLLVDDGSTDGTSDMVKARMPEAIILKGDGNLWWGGALHKAYQYLIKLQPDDCDSVIFMNDDAEIPDDFFECGYSHLQQHSNDLITACGYSINTDKIKDGPVIYDVKTGEARSLSCGEVGNCASTRSLMMSFKSFREIGGFHPILLPHYGSDYEYTIRACKKGKRVLSFNDFIYRFDENKTGYNNFKKLTMKKLFSKRSRFNPFYRFNLTVMTTPIWYIPRNICCGIKRAALEIKND